MRCLARSLLALAAVIGLVACGARGPDDYNLEIEQQFIDQCAAVSDREECRCLYRRISETVPFERFEEIDAGLEDGGEIPREIEDLAIGCAASVTGGD